MFNTYIFTLSPSPSLPPLSLYKRTITILTVRKCSFRFLLHVKYVAPSILKILFEEGYTNLSLVNNFPDIQSQVSIR